MKEEYQNSLFEKYPEIFRDRDKPPQQTAMCWGIACGDGWYWLIDKLCEFFMKIHRQTGAEVVATQVKEKFGGLSFYYSVINCTSEAFTRIHKMVWFFESLSYLTCDVCGGSGTVSTAGWRSTRCGKHK